MRTNDLIADDAGIHGVVFKKTVFQRLRMIDKLMIEKMIDLTGQETYNRPLMHLHRIQKSVSPFDCLH